VAATFAEAAATVATTEDTAASAALTFNTPLMVGALGAAAAAPTIEEELQGVESQPGDACSIAEHLAEEAEGRFSTYDTSITNPGGVLNVGTNVTAQVSVEFHF
jgi:hypothetical protein